MTHYGCWNRAPFADRVLLPTELVMENGKVKQIQRSYQFAMARDCQYTKSQLGKSDKRCDGCKHRDLAEK